MTLTLLLDLDDTLLDNSMADFLPAYLQAISTHLAPYAEPAAVIDSLMSGTRVMIRNQSPGCTLQEVFLPLFYPLFDQEPPLIDQVLERFYTEVFPGLKPLSRPRPEAVALVEGAFARGYQVAIATAPLFPRTAILQRLAWAGFTPEKHPFAFVPSFETCHFTKPNPAFLAELLARMGWPEGPVVMLGDDLKMDIGAARALGLPCFWVNPDHIALPVGEAVPTGSGSLDEFFPWLDSQPEERLLPDFNTPQALLAILRSTPAALNSMLTSLPAEVWTLQPPTGGWSLTEVICHLRDVETDVNLPRLHKVYAGGNPFLPGVDSDRWSEERAYAAQSGPHALSSFNISRASLLNLLEKLAPAEWQHTARHAIFGPTNLQELVSFICGHDRLHIRQVSELLGVFTPASLQPVADEPSL